MDSHAFWIRVCSACGVPTVHRYASLEAAAEVPIFWSAESLEPAYAPCRSCGSRSGYGVEQEDGPSDWDQLLTGESGI